MVSKFARIYPKLLIKGDLSVVSLLELFIFFFLLIYIFTFLQLIYYVCYFWA